MRQARLRSSSAVIRHVRPVRRRKRLPPAVGVALALSIAALAFVHAPAERRSRDDAVVGIAGPSESHSQTFTICSGGPRSNCVVDGDTFWLDGRKIRIADIDTPEIHPSRCAYEEQLGQAAKQRLLALLNAGPFQLSSIDRDQDIYGRALRVVSRGGVSLGEIMVREGLARSWDGHRHPWCV